KYLLHAWVQRDGFAFSPDSKKFAITQHLANWRTLVHVFDLPSGRDLLPGHCDPICYVGISADGNTLTTHAHRSSSYGICQWEIGTGKAISEADLSVRNLSARSPDGRLLATRYPYRDKLELWNTQKMIREIDLHFIGDASFTPDNKTLAVRGVDRKLRF